MLGRVTIGLENKGTVPSIEEYASETSELPHKSGFAVWKWNKMIIFISQNYAKLIPHFQIIKI